MYLLYSLVLQCFQCIHAYVLMGNLVIAKCGYVMCKYVLYMYCAALELKDDEELSRFPPS